MSHENRQYEREVRQNSIVNFNNIRHQGWFKKRGAVIFEIIIQNQGATVGEITNLYNDHYRGGYKKEARNEIAKIVSSIYNMGSITYGDEVDGEVTVWPTGKAPIRAKKETKDEKIKRLEKTIVQLEKLVVELRYKLDAIQVQIAKNNIRSF